MNLKLQVIEGELTVCKVASISDLDLGADLFFVGRTDEEISLVCRTRDVPQGTVEREDGWRAFRIQGMLDFSLTGILAKLSGVLSGAGIGIFALSTFNTDYVLVKGTDFERALGLLAQAGYVVGLPGDESGGMEAAGWRKP